MPRSPPICCYSIGQQKAHSRLVTAIRTQWRTISATKRPRWGFRIAHEFAETLLEFNCPPGWSMFWSLPIKYKRICIVGRNAIFNRILLFLIVLMSNFSVFFYWAICLKWDNSNVYWLFIILCFENKSYYILIKKSSF